MLPCRSCSRLEAQRRHDPRTLRHAGLPSKARHSARKVSFPPRKVASRRCTAKSAQVDLVCPLQSIRQGSTPVFEIQAVARPAGPQTRGIVRTLPVQDRVKSRPIAPLGPPTPAAAPSPPAHRSAAQASAPEGSPGPAGRVAHDLTRGSVRVIGRWKLPRGLPGPKSRWRSDLLVVRVPPGPARSWLHGDPLQRPYRNRRCGARPE